MKIRQVFATLQGAPGFYVAIVDKKVSKICEHLNLRYFRQWLNQPKFNKNLGFRLVELLQKCSRKRTYEWAEIRPIEEQAVTKKFSFQ